MGQRYSVDYWRDSGWYVGRLREMPGVFSQGSSLSALEKNIVDAWKLIVEEENGLESQPALELSCAQIANPTRD